uniref:Uncharacterized protein n=1 Tax=Anguilla anguilla TaxID=7936 RepID=A0A0E9TH85_ANGAN
MLWVVITGRDKKVNIFAIYYT